jgi:hypothetical protein
VKRWLVVEGKVEEDPATMAVSAPAADSVAETRVRVHIVSDLRQRLDDSNRLQERTRTIVSLKDDDDDDDDDDDKKDKAKAKDRAKDRPPAIVIPIGRDRGPGRLPAKPIQLATGDDAKATVGGGAPAQDYEVSAADHGLRPGQRVHVRLPHPESGKPQKVIPYSAVLYDPHGNSWTYTNPEPLVFIRHRIEVESIEGDHAVLQHGPATGATVVTVGAAELFGVEQRFGQ